MELRLRYAYEKATKNTIRFMQVGDDLKPAFAPAIATLYVQKSVFPTGEVPMELVVTVSSK